MLCRGGVAYGSTLPYQPLNVPSGGTSVYQDTPACCPRPRRMGIHGSAGNPAAGRIHCRRQPRKAFPEQPYNRLIQAPVLHKKEASPFLIDYHLITSCCACVAACASSIWAATGNRAGGRACGRNHAPVKINALIVSIQLYYSPDYTSSSA